MKKYFVLVVVLVLILGVSYGQGCSQCKLLAEQGSELDENSFGTNINSGIIYLMVIPYLILFWFFRKPIIRFFKEKFS